MATVTPTLTLASTDAFSDALSFSVTTNLITTAPSAGITRVSTDENPFGEGAGVLITEANTTGTVAASGVFIYIKHLGVLASDGTTACHASNDFITVSNEDRDYNFGKLQPGEFLFLPLMPFDGTDNGTEAGGIKVVKNSAAVMIEYAYFTRSTS
tara:strand:+ start:127 stop:591 length:465 start_codon:yes stop_codon:yes gene_type:complete